jgi:predicted nucleic acid-binding protein
MIDTSLLVAALIADHEHHAVARPFARDARRVPAIVLAETYAQLRRTFRQSAGVASAALAPWASSPRRVLPTTVRATVAVLRRAVELDLGGNVHDALVAQVCLDHDVSLATLDRRQHTIALALGVASTYPLA